MKKALLILGMTLLMAPAIWGQGCSVCTKTAAGMGDKSANGLNSGIIYLAFIPLVIMGGLGMVWWRYNKNS